MGVAPAPELGRVSSNPPGRHAGNLDNRELVAGSTLYIPVFVPGALFEVGDGHAAQGDGEVDQTAIETSLRGRLQLTVRKDMKLTWPRAETATDYISHGDRPGSDGGDDGSRSRRWSTSSPRQRTLTKHQAYQLVSIAGHVAITQLVDGRTSASTSRCRRASSSSLRIQSIFMTQRVRAIPFILITFFVLGLVPLAGQPARQNGSRPSETDLANARPGRDPNQPIDEEYTKKIKQYTTETFFLSPLVDYMPASKTVPTPKAVLGDIAGAPRASCRTRRKSTTTCGCSRSRRRA